MKRIDVVKKRDGWAGESGGRTVPGTKARTKAEGVKRTAAASKKGREPVSVRIRKLDGKIQEERTYPSPPIRAGARGKAGVTRSEPMRRLPYWIRRPFPSRLATKPIAELGSRE
jgi:hypothetical protein